MAEQKPKRRVTAQIPIPPVINSSPGNVATPQIRARAKVDPNSIASSSSPSAPRPTIRSTPSTSSLRSATSPSLNSASFTRPSLPHHASSSKSTASGINTPTQARLVRAHSQTPPISPASPSISMGPPALLHRGMTTPVPSRIRTGIAVMADSSPEIPILHRGVSEDSRSAPLKARVKMDPGFDSPRRASTTSNSHHELSSSANSSISGALRSHPPASTQMATEPGVDTTSGLSKSTSLLSPANVTDAPGSTFLPHYPPQTYFSAFHDENHHAESRMHMTDTPEPLFSPHMEHSNTSPPHLPHLPLSAIQTQHFPFPHFQHPTASCPPSPAPPSSRIPGDPSDTTSHQSDRLKSLEESELRRSSSIGHERSLRSFAMSNTGDRTRNRIPLPTHPNQGPILPPPPLSPTLRTIDLPFITPTRSRTASVQSPLPCVSPGTGLGFNHGSIPVPDMEIEQVRRPSGGSGSDLSSNSMSDPTSNPRHRLSSITRTDIENELISQRRSERDRLSGSTMVDEEFDGGTSAWNEGKRFVSDGRKIALREISPGGGSPDELDIVLETNAEQAKINRKIADLEISNASLLAINRSLETTKAKQRTELTKLRRLIRTSLGPNAPLTLSTSTSTNTEHNTELSPLIDQYEDFEEDLQDPELESRWEKITVVINAMKSRGERAVQVGNEEIRPVAQRVLQWTEVDREDSPMGAGNEDPEAEEPDARRSAVPLHESD